MFRNLLARATDAVRKRLVETANPATAKAINKILAEISQKVESATVTKRDYRGGEAGRDGYCRSRAGSRRRRWCSSPRR